MAWRMFGANELDSTPILIIAPKGSNIESTDFDEQRVEHQSIVHGRKDEPI
jgi:hypothetical protein